MVDFLNTVRSWLHDFIRTVALPLADALHSLRFLDPFAHRSAVTLPVIFKRNSQTDEVAEERLRTSPILRAQLLTQSATSAIRQKVIASSRCSAAISE